MSRFNHKHKLSPKAYLYRILFSLIAIAILVAFMPHGNTSAYHYQKGEPWDDEALIAQDSFPILKSPEQIAQEQDSLKQFYEPYFQQDEDALERQLTALKQYFGSTQGQSIPHYFFPHLSEKLRHIYSVGILSGESAALFDKEQPKQVRLYSGNESDVRQFSQLFSEKAAYEYLVHEDDSVRYNHSQLHGLDLTKFVQPNLAYDNEKSMQQRAEVDGRLVRTKGVVLQGQKIVDKGQIIDDELVNTLRSWEHHLREHKLTAKERLSRLGGRAVYAAILVVLLLMYFQQFRSDYLDSLRTVLLIMSLFLFFPIVTYIIIGHMWASVYLVPYCVLPIMLRIFLDSRTAFVTHVLSVLASAVVLTQPFTFIVTQIVAGLVAIYSLRELSQRSELFRAAVLVTLATLVTYLCMEFVRGTSDVQGISRWPYIYLVVAGVLSMLAYLLLIPIERIFGFTSIVTLVELQNVNNPLLRRLSEQANGTFNHSMQVANLAAEVADKLGGKVQLVRTGALYHDIGKLENAVFFTENQAGQKNPHDTLSYEQSAQIIIQHVENGLKLADKYKLPSAVKDFIATHHGKSLTKYFYIKAQQELPLNGAGRFAAFTYPGPKPQTLEQAILMMADGVEAASRSLTEYTEESISALVEKIVSAQVADGSFDECAITFREIAEAKEVLCARLRTIYHTRIQYPEG